LIAADRVVGVGRTGFGSVDRLVTVDPVWTSVLPPARRRPRAVKPLFKLDTYRHCHL